MGKTQNSNAASNEAASEVQQEAPPQTETTTEQINPDSPKFILLLGGLDNRQGDYNINEQVQILKKGLSSPLPITGFRYTDQKGIIAEINKSTEHMFVVGFSSGAGKSKNVALALKQKGFDRKYMFIVEPYNTNGSAESQVRAAVAAGVPAANVIVGPQDYRGKGVVQGTTSTPKGVDHWGALTFAGTLIK